VPVLRNKLRIFMSRSFKSALAAILLLGLAEPCSATLDEVAKALESGEPGSAIAQLQAMPDGERESYRGRLLYAGALAAQGKREEAAGLYRTLIKEAPELPEPYNNLAVLYAADGHLDKALQLLERAMKTSASYATVRDNLGRVYLEMSLNSYAKALQVDEREKPPALQVLYALNGRASRPTDSLKLAQAETAELGQAHSGIEQNAPMPSEGLGKAALEQAAPVALAVAEAKPVAPAVAEAEPAAPAVAEAKPAAPAVAEAKPAAPAVAEAKPAAPAVAEAKPAAPAVAGAKPAAPAVAETKPAETASRDTGPGDAEPVQARLESSGTSTDKLAAAQGRDPGPVLNAVQHWADAWQGQDVEGYLASYAQGFTPSHGLSREQWQAQRRQRLSKPGHIEVELEGLSVVFLAAGGARVRFLQRYRSDRYRDKTRKSLHLVDEAGTWKILSEKTLEVIR
jgi:colicin import membrane protein